MSAPDLIADDSRSVAPPATARGLIILLGALTAFGALSIDMYLPSLPTIARDLSTPGSVAQLTIAAFLIGLAFGQLVYGPLADRVGRRPPLLAGIGLYIFASIGCALAPRIELLIGFRTLQALGACAGMVIARAVVTDLFEPQRRVHVLSTLMLVMGLAPIFAPLAGGYLLLVGGWRFLFALLAVFGGVVGVVALLRLPETRPAHVAAHARSESSLRAYLALVTDRDVVGYVLTSALSSASLFAYISSSPMVLIETYHVPTQAFGWIFGLNGAGIIGAGQLNRVLAHRYAPRQILKVTNLAACGFSLLMLACAFSGLGGPYGVLVPLFFVLASYGLAQPNATAAAMQAGGARSGAASAMFGFAQSASGALAAGAAAAVYDGTARPMTTVVTLALLAAAGALKLTRSSER